MASMPSAGTISLRYLAMAAAVASCTQPTPPPAPRVVSAGLPRLPRGPCFAPVARFRFGAAADGRSTAELEEVVLLDARDDASPPAIDFASYEEVVESTGSLVELERALEELTRAPEAARLGALHDALVRHFEPRAEDGARWFWDVRGPVSCEACGRVRDLSVSAFFSYVDKLEPVFGAQHPGGVLAPGTRLEGDTAWTQRAKDHSTFVRLRPPGELARELRFASQPLTFGCGCTRATATLVTRFRVEPGALVFLGAALRVVREPDDLGDVDFAEAPTVSEPSQHMLPAHDWRPRTHEEVQREVLRRYGSTRS